MNTRIHKLLAPLLAVAGCAAALLVASCGSSNSNGKGIPPASAQALDQQLTSIQRRVDAKACADITGGSDPNTTVVAGIIDRLPRDTDSKLRSSLQDSFQNLFQLVQDACRPATTTNTTPTTSTPTETVTTPTETVTTPTETVTTPTTTTPKPKKKPKSQGNNKPSGGGGGSGSSGGGGGISAPGRGW